MRFREVLIFTHKYDYVNPEILSSMLLQPVTNDFSLANIARGTSLVRIRSNKDVDAWLL